MSKLAHKEKIAANFEKRFLHDFNSKLNGNFYSCFKQKKLWVFSN